MSCWRRTATPAQFEAATRIHGIEAAEAEGAVVFQAGTRMGSSGLETAGGRVLGVTASGADLRTAMDAAYSAARQIRFDGMHFRSDIGAKGLAPLLNTTLARPGLFEASKARITIRCSPAGTLFSVSAEAAPRARPRHRPRFERHPRVASSEYSALRMGEVSSLRLHVHLDLIALP